MIEVCSPSRVTRLAGLDRRLEAVALSGSTVTSRGSAAAQAWATWVATAAANAPTPTGTNTTSGGELPASWSSTSHRIVE